MIGLFGGSFDPIHLGHIIPLIDIKDFLPVKKVIFIPAMVSPFKKGKIFASHEHRINMIKIAIKNDAYFELSDFEIKKGGISYTIDTIKYFRNLYDEIALIIGDDNLKDFKSWKNWEQILKLSNVIILKRKGDTGELFPGMIKVNTRIIEISSTEIRNRIKEGKEIKHLVKEEVAEYIFKNNLYNL